MAKKVLVADDDFDIRATLRIALAGDFEVSEAADGQEALSAIRRENPRLVLLDVSMPGMDGVEVLRSALAADPGLKVVMLTAERDIEVARRALELGALAFITKPFDVDFLKAEVRRLMGSAEAAPPDIAGRPWRVVGC